MCISIHALVKRATVFNVIGKPLPFNFNPRPREEGDRFYSVLSAVVRYFNPRPREEGDSRKSTTSTKTRYFNPRPREEGDRSSSTAMRTV